MAYDIRLVKIVTGELVIGKYDAEAHALNEVVIMQTVPTQQGVQPPTIVLFVNDEKLMHFSYERYLENHLRKAFGFEGTPLRFILREKDKKEQHFCASVRTV